MNKQILHNSSYSKVTSLCCLISVFHAINFWCIFFILDLGKLFYFLPKVHSKYSKTLFKLGIFFPYIRNGSIKFFQKNSSHNLHDV